MPDKTKILYIHGNRAHKLLPLLDDHDCEIIYTFSDIFNLIRRKIKPLFILIDSFGLKGLLGYIVSVIFKAPLAIRLRGDFFEEVKERRDFYFRYFPNIRYLLSVSIAKFLLLKAKGIIFNSYFLQKKVSSYIHGNKISTVVYNPFTPLKKTDDEKIIPLDPNGFFLISATNMNLKSKVIYQLIRMIEIPKVKWESLNLYWYICGDGVFTSEVKRVIETAGLSKRIILTGKINNIEQYFKACHVCIHFSRMDAFPNTTMEAMNYGLPVITNHDSCGTLEQVTHKKNGLILRDTDSVLDAIKIYRDNQGLRIEHGIFGRDYVINKFSVPLQKKEMNDFIQKISEHL